MIQHKAFAITGIDTGIGKTIATGLIARGLRETGRKVITQKLVQTGCREQSDDIITHRRIMGCPLLPEDRHDLTCPYLFSTPCSPHLAAALAGEQIEPEKIRAATSKLLQTYEIVLLEGAGGLLVPLTKKITMLDYLQQEGVPVILVTSSRLGSLNHTFLALEVLSGRRVELAGVVYNHVGSADKRICEDSRAMIVKAMQSYGFSSPLVDMYDEKQYHQDADCRYFARLCQAKEQCSG